MDAPPAPPPAPPVERLIILGFLITVCIGVAVFALTVSFLPGPQEDFGRISFQSRLGSPGPYRVASFTLFGSGARYTDGIVTNAISMRENFPGWIMRVYIKQSSIPVRVLREISRYSHVEIIPVKLPGNMESKLWRFSAALSPPLPGSRTPDVVIVRDCDSVTSARDASSVKAWLQSDSNFHIIRDNKAHRLCKRPILAGLWGMRGPLLQDKPFTAAFNRRISGAVVQSAGDAYAADERFLMEQVYPYVRQKAFVSVSSPSFLWPGERLGQLLPPSGPETQGFLGQIIL